MSYLNDEQLEEVKCLSSLTPDKVCWYGWFPLGKCNVPNPCDPKYTMADRLKVTCECGNFPHKPDAKLNHRYGCKHETTSNKEKKHAVIDN